MWTDHATGDRLRQVQVPGPARAEGGEEKNHADDPGEQRARMGGSVRGAGTDPGRALPGELAENGPAHFHEAARKLGKESGERLQAI